VSNADCKKKGLCARREPARRRTFPYSFVVYGVRHFVLTARRHDLGKRRERPLTALAILSGLGPYWHHGPKAPHAPPVTFG
jgi:hypothetical protein